MIRSVTMDDTRVKVMWRVEWPVNEVLLIAFVLLLTSPSSTTQLEFMLDQEI